jgi:hypothetical protein
VKKISTSMPSFTTTTQLNQWLHQHSIDTTAWGRGSAKTVADLWTEFLQGESTFYPEPPLRHVGVVELQIRQGIYTLIEASQTLRDGRTRQRGQLPAEKIKQGETPFTTALRCLGEELQITDRKQLRFAHEAPEQTLTTRQFTAESGSYPGLTTLFTIYTLPLEITGLPTTAFATTNAAASEGDPVAIHHWQWVLKDEG